MAGGMYEPDVRGMGTVIQEIGDAIFQARSDKTPIMRLLPRGKQPKQMLAEWPVQISTDRAFTPGGDDDIDTFDKTTREKLSGYGMRLVTKGWMVGKTATWVESAGVPDEVAKQKRDNGLELALMAERQILSALDLQAKSANAEYRSRGMFSWLSPSEQSVLPVPANYRPSSACQYTGALASLTPALFRALLDAAEGQVLEAVELLGIVGADLKTQMSTWTERQFSSTNTSASSTVFNLNAADKRLVQILDEFEFDSGSVVRTVKSYNLACTEATGARSSYSAKSGLFVKLGMWSLCWYQAPQSYELPDLGAGPRGYHDCGFLLKCLMPRGQVSVYTAT